MVAAVILSAGESRRMGSPKALLPLPHPPSSTGEPAGKTTTFIEHLVGVFGRSHASPLVVVLGHEPDVIRDAVDLAEATVIVNTRYRDGMLSSIRAGIEALGDDADGALVCPVDHPEVTTGVINQLITGFEASGAPIVLPVSSGRRGHPVLFSRAVFPDLLRAPETVGARQVVWDYERNLLEVEVKDPGIRVDIDTPEEYRSFRKRVD